MPVEEWSLEWQAIASTTLTSCLVGTRINPTELTLCNPVFVNEGDKLQVRWFILDGTGELYVNSRLATEAIVKNWLPQKREGSYIVVIGNQHIEMPSDVPPGHIRHAAILLMNDRNLPEKVKMAKSKYRSWWLWKPHRRLPHFEPECCYIDGTKEAHYPVYENGAVIPCPQYTV